MAQGDAISVNRTKDRDGARHLRHAGRFAEAHLAHALAKLRVTGELADASDGASSELAEGKPNVGSGLAHEGLRELLMRLGFNDGSRKRPERGKRERALKNFLAAAAFDGELDAAVAHQILQVFVLLRVDVFGGLEFVFGAFERGHDGILVNFFFGDRIFGEH